jgi:hypothetical protein
MTTTSELHAIVEALGLIDMGDAASYLGEEMVEIEGTSPAHVSLSFLASYENAVVPLLRKCDIMAAGVQSHCERLY